MFNKFMTDNSNEILRRALPLLVTEINVMQSESDYWICYGSLLLGLQNNQSDIDLLYIHHDPHQQPSRIQSSFEEWPVTIYALNESDFKADGEQRKYGGYFSGKVINPHAVLGGHTDSVQATLKVAGGFIGQFAASLSRRRGREIASPGNIAADCFLAFLHLCPWYRAYFMRYFVDPRFADIWQTLQASVTTSLVLAKEVTKLSPGYFEYQNPLDEAQFHIEMIKVVARFWAVGACFHGGRIDFPDYYFEKSEQFLRRTGYINHCAKLYDFLNTQAK